MNDGWQRLSPWALVFLFINGLQQFIRQNLYAFAGAGAGFAFVESLGLRELLLGGLVLVLVGIVFTLIYHRRFRFRLEDDALRVRKGIFEQKELRVRFDRVQNVSSSQPFYLRPFGLVRFGLETPGAAHKEVELPGIDAGLAESMRARIATWHRQAPAAGDPAESGTQEEKAPEAEDTLFEPPPSELFVYGLTSNQVWVLAGALAALSDTVLDRIGDRLPGREWLGERIASEGLHWLLAIPAAAAALLAVLMLLSGIIALVRFYGYRLWAEGDRFRARFGLLDTREKTLRQSKLQGLRMAQSGIGRMLRRWYLVGRQTGAESAELNNRGERFLVPGLNAEGAIGLARTLQPEITGWPEWQPVSPILRWVLMVRMTLLLCAAALIAWSIPPFPLWIPLGMLGANLLLLGAIWLRWSQWGWAQAGNLVWIRRGFIGRQIDVFEIDRIQQIALRRNPLQRRRGLASLVIRVPHGAVEIPWIDHDTACDLADEALYRVESALDHEV